MAAGRNKVLLPLAGRPMLAHSVATFGEVCQRLLLVAAELDLVEVCALFPTLETVLGGSTRHASEWNALRHLQRTLAEDDVIAIHDGARPLVARSDVERVFEVAERFGCAMLAAAAGTPALDVETNGASSAVVRAYPAASVWRAQTPQAARAGLLLGAYQQAQDEGFDGSDTAAVLTRHGCAVHLVAAGAPNPKITLPADMREAERLLRSRSR